MKTINGEDYFEIKDLAEFWGITPKSVNMIFYRCKLRNCPYPRADIGGEMRGRQSFYKKSRLGELNEWYKKCLEDGSKAKREGGRRGRDSPKRRRRSL